MDTWKKFRASRARRAGAFLSLDTASMQAFAEDLLDKDGRLYIGMTENGQLEAFFVACPRDIGFEEDAPTEASQANGATVYDLTNPCPPICP